MENRAGVSKAKHLLLIEVHPGSSWRHCNFNCFYENSHVVNFKQSLGDQPAFNTSQRYGYFYDSNEGSAFFLPKK